MDAYGLSSAIDAVVGHSDTIRRTLSSKQQIALKSNRGAQKPREMTELYIFWRSYQIFDHDGCCDFEYKFVHKSIYNIHEGLM